MPWKRSTFQDSTPVPLQNLQGSVVSIEAEARDYWCDEAVQRLDDLDEDGLVVVDVHWRLLAALEDRGGPLAPASPTHRNRQGEAKTTITKLRPSWAN